MSCLVLLGNSYVHWYACIMFNSWIPVIKYFAFLARNILWAKVNEEKKQFYLIKYYWILFLLGSVWDIWLSVRNNLSELCKWKQIALASGSYSSHMKLCASVLFFNVNMNRRNGSMWIYFSSWYATENNAKYITSRIRH